MKRDPSSSPRCGAASIKVDDTAALDKMPTDDGELNTIAVGGPIHKIDNDE